MNFFARIYAAPFRQFAYILAFSATVHLEAAEAADKVAALPSAPLPHLMWRARDVGSSEVGDLVTHPRGIAGVRRRKGAATGKARTQAVMTMGAIRLAPAKEYYAELPESVRRGPSFVQFIISGVAKTKPEDGTILDMDGAVVGFRLTNKPAAQAEAADEAQLVVMDLDSNGELKWRETGLYFALDPGKALTGSPKLCARLDPENLSWTLLYRDIVVEQDLPLISGQLKPTLSVRASSGGEDAVLKNLEFRSAPPARSAVFPAAVNGVISLDAAFKAKNPNVSVSTASVDPKP